MPAPATVDIESLLLPISDDRPAGEWLPDVHGLIEQARRSDDDLPQGEWKRETKVADWRAVIKIATEALAAKTKDLKTAAFLVEALVKEHGLPGLRDGLRLLRELHERFWESLHPEIEDGDLEGRIVPIEWLNGKLPACVKEIGVTRSRDGVVYSLLQWEESRAVENLGRQNAEARDRAIAEGKLSGEQFDKAVAFTPRAFYEGVLEDLDTAGEEWSALDRVIDEKFGRDAPSLVEVRKSLEQCRELVYPILKRKRELEPDKAVAPHAPADRSAGVAQPTQAAKPTKAADGTGDVVPIEPLDREDALHRLAAVSTFFRRTEPHSPVAYLVERAVHWGGMPLDQWLREVINDDAVLARVRETLGLRDQPPPEDGESQ